MTKSEEIGATAARILTTMAQIGVREDGAAKNRGGFVDALVVSHRGVMAIERVSGKPVTATSPGPAWCAHAVASAWGWACLAHGVDPRGLLKTLSGGAENCYSDKRIPEAWRISPARVRAGVVLIPGDLIVRKGHIGMVRKEWQFNGSVKEIPTVEGNTNGENSTDGNGVYLRDASMTVDNILGVTRPFAGES